ncbi:Fructosamine kinase-domain-containing protein [Xylariomycetidae sp. FL0641]|nr:Fructosamine kinase-domain-containing protein [Xylariomycetidae sp. FL0641]
MSSLQQDRGPLRLVAEKGGQYQIHSVDSDIQPRSTSLGEENIVVDDNVVACLPAGARVLKVEAWNASAWTKNFKLTAELSNGTQKAFFLKCATERGALMMEGEYTSLSAIRDVVPSFAPQPHGRGKLKSSEASFLIMDFLDLDKAVLPDPKALCARLVDLHLKSVSPTGRFGFHMPTCHGKNVQPNTWDPSWSSCFTRLITAFYAEDLRVNGPWEEFDCEFETLKTRTIPRLLEPLQSGGRALKPCLVHGDLWDENTGVSVASGEPVVFDASVSYAHNEYEIGMWRREVVRFDERYIREYLRLCPPSEPAAQWDDRNRLYSIKFNFGHSISFPGSIKLREGYVYRLPAWVRDH